MTEAHPERGGLLCFGMHYFCIFRLTFCRASDELPPPRLPGTRKTAPQLPATARIVIATHSGTGRRLESGRFSPFGIENEVGQRLPGSRSRHRPLLQVTYYKCRADLEVLRHAKLGP